MKLQTILLIDFPEAITIIKLTNKRSLKS